MDHARVVKSDMATMNEAKIYGPLFDHDSYMNGVFEGLTFLNDALTAEPPDLTENDTTRMKIKDEFLDVTKKKRSTKDTDEDADEIKVETLKEVPPEFLSNDSSKLELLGNAPISNVTG